MSGLESPPPLTIIVIIFGHGSIFEEQLIDNTFLTDKNFNVSLTSVFTSCVATINSDVIEYLDREGEIIANNITGDERVDTENVNDMIKHIVGDLNETSRATKTTLINEKGIKGINQVTRTFSSEKLNCMEFDNKGECLAMNMGDTYHTRKWPYQQSGYNKFYNAYKHDEDDEGELELYESAIKVGKHIKNTKDKWKNKRTPLVKFYYKVGEKVFIGNIKTKLQITLTEILTKIGTYIHTLYPKILINFNVIDTTCSFIPGEVDMKHERKFGGKKYTNKTKKHRRKKMRTRKQKGGAPTPSQLKRASKGLTRKNRPPPLKISKTPSPDNIKRNVYNPLSPTHAKKLTEIIKQKMINNPLSPSNQLHFMEIYIIPEHMDQDTQYFFIDDDKTREIFKFGMDDTKLKRTGFAYIDEKWEKL